MDFKDKLGGLVFSTNRSLSLEDNKNEETENLKNSDQLLHLHRETKGRGGKAVVLIRGFVGSENELNELAKKLKAHCGTGGSAKDGEIIIQGEQRDKVDAFLKKEGYKTKRVGG